VCLQAIFAIILSFSDNSSTDIILTNSSLHVEVLSSIVEAPTHNFFHMGFKFVKRLAVKNRDLDSTYFVQLHWYSIVLFGTLCLSCNIKMVRVCEMQDIGYFLALQLKSPPHIQGAIWVSRLLF
jgi:hypothetical protein